MNIILTILLYIGAIGGLIIALEIPYYTSKAYKKIKAKLNNDT